MDPATSRLNQWKRATWILTACLVGIIALCWETTQTLVDSWAHSRTYAHGFLVLPATLYLVWSCRSRLLDVCPAANVRGLIFTAILMAGWFVGAHSRSLLIQEVAVVAMVPALVWGILGSQVMQRVKFHLGFLAFALPIGASIEPCLQRLTTTAVVLCLDMAGIPFQREGYLIIIPSGTWEVSPDCGGLRYLLPGLALGYVFTGMMHQTFKQRLVFLLLCAFALMAANIARASGIILADHLRIADGADHRVFSYALYSVTMLALGWLGFKWSEASSHPEVRLG